MSEAHRTIAIRSIRQHEDYGLIIQFSDGTFAQYAVEELVALRPYRESATAAETCGHTLRLLPRPTSSQTRNPPSSLPEEPPSR